ncbi:uncharacterized protein [Ptychodera flava]|uniref:uncharacterized protein n=1 Tax=Ptychodera flava TaxID=63121 RepID=UPI00396A3017
MQDDFSMKMVFKRLGWRVLRRASYALALCLLFVIAQNMLHFRNQDVTPKETAEIITNESSHSLKDVDALNARPSTTTLTPYTIRHKRRRPLNDTTSRKGRLEEDKTNTSEIEQEGETEDLLVFDFLGNLHASCRTELINLVKKQVKTRRRREQDFMKVCRWDNMSDRKWYQMMTHGKYLPGKTVRPATGGTDPRAGSVSVGLEYGEEKRDAWFKVAPIRANGRGEKHVSQIAVFILDRLLGFYYAVPSRGSKLNVNRLSNLQITPLKFKTFVSRLRDLIDDDGHVQGSVNAWISESLVLPSFKLRQDVNLSQPLQPLDQHERWEMEFRTLLWLTGLALRNHNTRVTEGTEYPVIFDSDRAFRDQTTTKSEYFLNCQFPKHVISYLNVTSRASRRCSLAEQISAALQTDPLQPDIKDFKTRYRIHSTTQAFKVLDLCVDVLLKMVDKCIALHGEDAVLYEDL